MSGQPQSKLSFSDQVGETSISVVGTRAVLNGRPLKIRHLDELLASLQLARDVVTETENREFQADSEIEGTAAPAATPKVVAPCNPIGSKAEAQCNKPGCAFCVPAGALKTSAPDGKPVPRAGERPANAPASTAEDGERSPYKPGIAATAVESGSETAGETATCSFEPADAEVKELAWALCIVGDTAPNGVSTHEAIARHALRLLEERTRGLRFQVGYWRADAESRLGAYGIQSNELSRARETIARLESAYQDQRVEAGKWLKECARLEKELAGARNRIEDDRVNLNETCARNGELDRELNTSKSEVSAHSNAAPTEPHEVEKLAKLQTIIGNLQEALAIESVGLAMQSETVNRFRKILDGSRSQESSFSRIARLERELTEAMAHLRRATGNEIEGDYVCARCRTDGALPVPAPLSPVSPSTEVPPTLKEIGEEVDRQSALFDLAYRAHGGGTDDRDAHEGARVVARRRVARALLEEKAKLRAEILRHQVERGRDANHFRELSKRLTRKETEVGLLKKEREQLEVQLAGCGVAALGWSRGEQKAKPGDYGWSASYGDVVKLRERMEATEAASNEPPVCRGCCKRLLGENFRIADGCPCNSPRGVNHGLVSKNTCTCEACDPEQTGSTRYAHLTPQTPAWNEAQRHVVGRLVIARMVFAGEVAEYVNEIEQAWRDAGSPAEPRRE